MALPKYNPTKVGAVVTFPEGTTSAQVVALLEQLKEKSKIDGYEVGIYDPNWGGPVWYIP